MNILVQELKMGRKSLIIWCTSLLGVLLLFMSLYPSISIDMADLQKVFASFPPAIQQAFGLNSLFLTSILNFYSFTLTYILLAGSVQAMNLGISVLSAEVRDKTGDFLFVKPLSRNRIITIKILAVFIELLITNIFFFIGSFFFLTLFSEHSFDYQLFILLTGTLFLLQLFFCSLGLFISVFFKRIRTVLPISMGVVFLFYVVYLLNETLDDVKLSYLSPFGYFDLSTITQNIRYDSTYLILWSILVAVFVFFTFWIFGKKDLPSI
jgi:ABC-2 type transport system permease protein